MMHGLTVKAESLLHDMMTSLSFQNITENIQVNSVHWKVPIAIPQNDIFGIEVSARSKIQKQT
jgi:hypothetical protein